MAKSQFVAAVDYLLNVELRVLGLRFLLLLPYEQPPYGKRSKDEAEDGDGSDPDVDEAWRKIVSMRAQRAPTLFVSAERLLEGARREVVDAQLAERAETRERAGLIENLLLVVKSHCVPWLEKDCGVASVWCNYRRMLEQRALVSCKARLQSRWRVRIGRGSELQAVKAWVRLGKLARRQSVRSLFATAQDGSGSARQAKICLWLALIDAARSRSGQRFNERWRSKDKNCLGDFRLKSSRRTRARILSK